MDVGKIKIIVIRKELQTTDLYPSADRDYKQYQLLFPASLSMMVETSITKKFL